jgi:hypothetical protein
MDHLSREKTVVEPRGPVRGFFESQSQKLERRPAYAIAGKAAN